MGLKQPHDVNYDKFFWKIIYQEWSWVHLVRYKRHRYICISVTVKILATHSMSDCEGVEDDASNSSPVTPYVPSQGDVDMRIMFTIKPNE